MKNLKILICGGYNTNFLEEYLEKGCLKNNIQIIQKHLPYNVFRTVFFNDKKELVIFKPDYIYFCIGVEHFSLVNVTKETNEFIKFLLLVQKIYQCDLIVNNLIYPRLQDSAMSVKINYFNSKLDLMKKNGIYKIDCLKLAQNIGFNNWYSERDFFLTKNPCDFDHLNTYVENIVKFLSAQCGNFHKLVIVDLDNTMWGGVVGDVGVQNIKIGIDDAESESYSYFQRYLKSLHKNGLLFAISSKNDIKIIQKVFKNRIMPFSLADFSYIVCDWTSKAIHIKDICSYLNISYSSTIFIDDNPAERYIVKKTFPEITVPKMSIDSSSYVRNIEACINLSNFETSKTDLIRGKSFKSKDKRSRIIFENKNSSIKLLKTKLTFSKFNSDNISRVSQLFSKTNQFNLTQKQYGIGTLKNLSAKKNIFHLCVNVSDRFGDLGLVIAILGRVTNKKLYIENWVMSCRVFSRDLELATLSKVISYCKKENINKITIPYNQTVKNTYAIQALDVIIKKKNRLSYVINTNDILVKNLESEQS